MLTRNTDVLLHMCSTAGYGELHYQEIPVAYWKIVCAQADYEFKLRRALAKGSKVEGEE